MSKSSRQLVLLVGGCVLLCAVLQVQASDDDEGMKLEDVVGALEPFAEGCEPTPEKEHLEQLALNEENPHYTTKCFRRCLFERFQLVEPDQFALDKEKSVEMMSVMWPDRDSDLEEIIETCNAESAALTDKCENAHSIGMCNLRELRERGFDVPEVKP